jgi:hypothetical protein
MSLDRENVKTLNVPVDHTFRQVLREAGVTEETIQASWWDLLSEGSWENNDSGDGVMLTVTDPHDQKQKPVIGSDGKQVEFRFGPISSGQTGFDKIDLETLKNTRGTFEKLFQSDSTEKKAVKSSLRGRDF